MSDNLRNDLSKAVQDATKGWNKQEISKRKYCLLSAGPPPGLQPTMKTAENRANDKIDLIFIFLEFIISFYSIRHFFFILFGYLKIKMLL